MRQPEVRDALRREFDEPRQLAFGWSQLRVVGVRDESHQDWVGQTVAEIAGGAGTDELDTFIDLSLEEDLETVFVIDRR